MKEGIKIGWVMCGSFCTFDAVTAQMKRLVEAGADVTPILSYSAASLDTRFGAADNWKQAVRSITGKAPLLSLPEVEPIGPRGMFDLLLAAPCTGTTLGKLAHGISNTPAT
ncbi:MAG: dipicolinate synthase subunit B, partial [Clostridia bacterium]|nr:dipicolinate synthase subunit B [Clostridia bacterium]